MGHCVYDITISSVMAAEFFGNCHMYPERYDMNRFAMHGFSIPNPLLEIKQNEGKSICIHSFFPSCQGSLYLRTRRSFFQLNEHSICLQTGIFCVDQVLCYFAWRLLDLDSKDFNHTFLRFMSSMLDIVLDYNQY